MRKDDLYMTSLWSEVRLGLNLASSTSGLIALSVSALLDEVLYMSAMDGELASSTPSLFIMIASIVVVDERKKS